MGCELLTAELPPAGAADVTLSPPGAFFPETTRFRPLALLGRGSMGVVYRVYDAETAMEVALKTIGVRTAEQLYYLKQEFRLLAPRWTPEKRPNVDGSTPAKGPARQAVGV